MNVGQLFVLFGVQVNKQSFGAAEQAIKQLRAAAAIVGVVQLGRGLMHLAEHAGTSATHVLNMSAALGMSTNAIQEWGYVATQAGSNIDQFGVGISMFERNLREFASGRGSRRFKDAMRDIGLSQREAVEAQTKPGGVNELVFKISDAYQRMGNTVARAAINTGLFGARARGMAHDLQGGGAALRAQIAHFREIGGLIGNEELLRLKTMSNALSDIRISWGAATSEIISTLAPMITKLLADIAKWIRENRELISEMLTVGFTLLMGAVRGIMAVFSALGAIIHGALNGDAGALALVTALAYGILSVLIPAVVTLGITTFAALAPVLLPMLVVFAVMLVVVGLVKLVSENWDTIVEALSKFWQWFVHILGLWFQGFIALLKLPLALLVMAGKAVIGLFASLGRLAVELGSAFKDIWTDSWAEHLLDFIIDKVKALIGLLGDIRDFFSGNSPGAKAAEASPEAKQLQGEGWMIGGAASEMGAGLMFEPEANPPSGSAAAVQRAAASAAPRGAAQVNVGPTTININGVKDAAQAKDNIADSMDGVHRHAAAALGGEVQ